VGFDHNELIAIAALFRQAYTEVTPAHAYRFATPVNILSIATCIVLALRRFIDKFVWAKFSHVLHYRPHACNWCQVNHVQLSRCRFTHSQ